MLSFCMLPALGNASTLAFGVKRMVRLQLTPLFINAY